MTNLFHYAIHVDNKAGIIEDLKAFYRDILGADAGVYKDELCFAKFCNTLFAFEVIENAPAHPLSFYGLTQEKVEAILKNCKAKNIPYTQNDGKILLKDPAGNSLSFEAHNVSNQHRSEGLRVELLAKNLDETKRFYESKLNCKGEDFEADSILIQFYGHEIIFKKGEQIAQGWVFEDKDKSEAQKTQFIAAQHFGISDFTQADIDQLINTFQGNFVLEPMIASKGSENEQIYGFTLDPNGYVLELRYMNNPDIKLSEIEKITQQDVKVEKQRYFVHKDALTHKPQSLLFAYKSNNAAQEADNSSAIESQSRMKLAM